jgi:hypothetical protein
VRFLFLLVAAALQRQGRPAGGARRVGEGAVQGGLQGLGLAVLGVAMQGHDDVLVVRTEEGRRWTSGAGQGCARH